jgi:tetratricopeptide (TPR) repeat protein
MPRRSFLIFSSLSALLLAGVLSRATDSTDAAEPLARHRTLGKAYYENPAAALQAVAEFKKALDLAPQSNREKLNYGLALLRAGKTAEGVAHLQEVQQKDPQLPHTWFNLGIYYKKSGDAKEAVRQFERMEALVPAEPIVHYQLGTLYKLQGRQQDAMAQFVRASELDPRLAAARFQLYNMYRQAGRQSDAAEALRIFQELKKEAENSAIPEDVEWCSYAEIYDPPASPTPEPEATSLQEQTLTGTVDPDTAGLLAIDAGGTGQVDLLVWSKRGVDLYRRGVERAEHTGLDGLTGVISVAAGDFDNDGLMDLCVLTEAGPQLYRNTGGAFARYPAALPQRRFDRAVWLDYDHDYDLDLLLLGEDPALLRNQGSAGFVERTADFPFVKGRVAEAQKLRTIPDSKAFDLAVFFADRPPVLYRDRLGGRYTVTSFTGPKPQTGALWADFNGDGRPDRARISDAGKIELGLSHGPASRRWIRVQLQGVKSLKLAQDAEIEIKAGSLYRKQTYAGFPLVFDIGSRTSVDTVRITWPNGLIQNEVNQPVNRAYTYKEAQRLSGSCPMIWTWDGEKIRFITDVLGVAPLGASDGEGSYFPVDHDEYVSIPASALAPAGGQYDIRVTEELSEVSYLDQIILSAVDHPTDTEVFTNEKFKAPPYPEFRLFGVKRRIYPTTVIDDSGRDVLPQILALDQSYPGRFARSPLGVADLHTLELDFGRAAPAGRAVLFLNGWVDWPDGSTFRAAAQESKRGMITPYLQMQDAAGRWRTVIEDMGLPAGKPKTIAVPVQFLSADRKLRIVTNLCVYWDEIFLSEDTAEPRTIQRPVPLVSADLHFRGFSESRIHPERKQPDTFFYDHVLPASFWNPTPGFYTRYGDVRELLAQVDDRYVIMGSGDELRLRFQGAALPPVASGWKRDFLLKVDGWAKDRDPNTAFSASVEPLPFHGMSRYPYPSNQHYPADPAHERYRREYNTRPALRLIRPLVEPGL